MNAQKETLSGKRVDRCYGSEAWGTGTTESPAESAHPSHPVERRIPIGGNQA